MTSLSLASLLFEQQQENKDMETKLQEIIELQKEILQLIRFDLVPSLIETNLWRPIKPNEQTFETQQLKSKTTDFMDTTYPQVLVFTENPRIFLAIGSAAHPYNEIDMFCTFEVKMNYDFQTKLEFVPTDSIEEYTSFLKQEISDFVAHKLPEIEQEMKRKDEIKARRLERMKEREAQ